MLTINISCKGNKKSVRKLNGAAQMFATLHSLGCTLRHATVLIENQVHRDVVGCGWDGRDDAERKADADKRAGELRKQAVVEAAAVSETVS